jgi:hypothetical protein
MLLQVVFSETWWIGKKEDNPHEDQLPMPPSLRAAEEAVKNVTWAGHEEGAPYLTSGALLGFRCAVVNSCYHGHVHGGIYPVHLLQKCSGPLTQTLDGS